MAKKRRRASNPTYTVIVQVLNLGGVSFVTSRLDHPGLLVAITEAAVQALRNAQEFERKGESKMIRFKPSVRMYE